MSDDPALIAQAIEQHSTDLLEELRLFNNDYARRDRFAAAALTGLLGTFNSPNAIGVDPQYVAEAVVKIADALIAELDKEPTP